MLILISPVFRSGADIPADHTCTGMDRSPPLEWLGAPPETACFALVCESPVSPVRTWCHWVIWNIPGDAERLPEGMPVDEFLPAGVRQGLNSWRLSGYRGPCPPRRATRRLVFRLFALDAPLTLPTGTRRRRLLRAIRRHALDEATLEAAVSKPRRRARREPPAADAAP